MNRGAALQNGMRENTRGIFERVCASKLCCAMSACYLVELFSADVGVPDLKRFYARETEPLDYRTGASV